MRVHYAILTAGVLAAHSARAESLLEASLRIASESRAEECGPKKTELMRNAISSIERENAKAFIDAQFWKSLDDDQRVNFAAWISFCLFDFLPVFLHDDKTRETIALATPDHTVNLLDLRKERRQAK